MIGPRSITLTVCDGCDALRIKQVRQTSPVHTARCAEAGDRLISGLRQVYDAPPAWCPVVRPMLRPVAERTPA